MFRILAATAILSASVATAQGISYQTDKPAPIKGDSDKIVCQKEEKIGTRLGATKVCLTVAEWRERREADRDITEKVQSGVRVCANPPCPDLGI